MKKKTSLNLIVFVYAGLMVASTLFVPVKAYIGSAGGDDPDAYTELGYYPIWNLAQNDADKNDTDQNNGTNQTPVKTTRVVISLNVSTWIVQNTFITLFLGCFYYRTYRYYKEIENL